VNAARAGILPFLALALGAFVGVHHSPLGKVLTVQE
jgi:hypothetical protein